MKKSMGLLLSVVLLFSFSTSVALAKSKDSEKVKKVTVFNEIKDIDLLYDRAVKGISEEGPGKSKLSGLVKNNDTNLTAEATVYSTTQKLGQVEYENGSTDTLYSTTSFYDVSELDFNSTITPLSSGNGNKYKEGLDSTAGVRAYSTLYYTWNDDEGPMTIDLTSVVGGWMKLDSQYTFGTRTVNYGASGPSAVNGALINQSSTYNPGTSTTFNIPTPSSWVAIVIGEYAVVGATQILSITRGGTTWSFSFSNIYGE